MDVLHLVERMCESSEGVKSHTERVDLCGGPVSSGEVQGTSREVWGTSGKPLDLLNPQ